MSSIKRFHDERVALEKAFRLFLREYRQKDSLRFKYYYVTGIQSVKQYSYIGYKTQDGGRFGLHYELTRGQYYFGVQDRNNRLQPLPLYANQAEKIPTGMKEGFRRSVGSRITITLDRKEWEKTSMDDDLVSE
jgi:hypothetical protein